MKIRPVSSLRIVIRKGFLIMRTEFPIVFNSGSDVIAIQKLALFSLFIIRISKLIISCSKVVHYVFSSLLWIHFSEYTGLHYESACFSPLGIFSRFLAFFWEEFNLQTTLAFYEGWKAVPNFLLKDRSNDFYMQHFLEFVAMKRRIPTFVGYALSEGRAGQGE